MNYLAKEQTIKLINIVFIFLYFPKSAPRGPLFSSTGGSSTGITGSGRRFISIFVGSLKSRHLVTSSNGIPRYNH